MEKINMGQMRALKNGGENVCVINVLSKAAYRKEHIPRSINIPLTNDAEFIQQVESVVPSKAQKIVVYCAGPACSSSREAAKQLDKAGFSYVLAFEGGMEEWKNAGEPTEKGPGRKIHTETD